MKKRLLVLAHLILVWSAAISAHAQALLVVNYANGTAGAGSVGLYSLAGAALNPSLISGLTSPTGVAVDSAGNIYVAFQAGVHRVSKYDSSGGLISANYITGLGAPQGLAFDSSGNLYVGNTSTNTIGKYDSSGTAINASYITTNLSVPIGIAFDTAGNMAVVNATPPATGNKVTRFNSSGSVIDSTFIGSLNGPQFIVYDGFGSVYVSNASFVGKYSETTGTTVTAGTPSFISSIGSAEGLVVSGSTIFVADQTNNRIGAYSISTGAGNASFITGLNAPYGMALAIPEPSTYACIAGVFGLIFAGLRRRR